MTVSWSMSENVNSGFDSCVARRVDRQVVSDTPHRLARLEHDTFLKRPPPRSHLEAAMDARNGELHALEEVDLLAAHFAVVVERRENAHELLDQMHSARLFGVICGSSQPADGVRYGQQARTASSQRTCSRVGDHEGAKIGEAALHELLAALVQHLVDHLRQRLQRTLFSGSEVVVSYVCAHSPVLLLQLRLMPLRRTGLAM